ncbi:MAG: FKBP-type peptidyl-prolyl cis-trans isomerase, partial [Ignavibacteriaceae bacterium]
VIKLQYYGYFTDGKKFDSSVEKDEPLNITYKVQPFIKGFQEGLGLMKKGTKAELIIPSDLAYGSRGNGKIPANSTLVFDIQILDVQKPAK